eukprot:TRINITY_DN5443_c0_g4_i1.p1 TRINITY_DN5443_c0_g4~~TRINITY_DN5443_c0_g4_i1.p1  ORF type:complete len:665 (-),score=114.89 TRINITY_DN5443_c0_g4_i1:158-2152(-)
MEQYELLEVLGRGSYGVARLVRWLGRGHSSGSLPLAAAANSAADDLYVVKTIDLSDMTKGARQEAEREAAVLKSLCHPNIVAHVETCLDDQQLCIIMQYADAGDLASAIARRKNELSFFTEEAVLSAFAQCCAGLEHVHSKRILHRDLKSQNIFLNSNGRLQLGDFGIAKILAHTTSKAKTAVGTPYYASPEVCDNRAYSFKADVWSLGVVLYQLMSLEIPFKAPSLVALVLKIIQTEPPPLPSRYSERAQDVCSQTLRKDPEARPSTAELLQLSVVMRATAHGAAACQELIAQRLPTPSLLSESPPAALHCQDSILHACPQGTGGKNQTFWPGGNISSGRLCSSNSSVGLANSGNSDPVDALLAALSTESDNSQLLSDLDHSSAARASSANSADPGQLSARAAHLVQKEQEMLAAQTLALHGDDCGMDQARLEQLFGLSAPLVAKPSATPCSYAPASAGDGSGHRCKSPLWKPVAYADLDRANLACPARAVSPTCHVARRGYRKVHPRGTLERQTKSRFSLAPLLGMSELAMKAPASRPLCHVSGEQEHAALAHKEHPGGGRRGGDQCSPPVLMQLATGARRTSRVQSLPDISSCSIGSRRTGATDEWQMQTAAALAPAKAARFGGDALLVPPPISRGATPGSSGRSWRSSSSRPGSVEGGRR